MDSMAGRSFGTGCLAPADPVGCELITGDMRVAEGRKQTTIRLIRQRGQSGEDHERE